MMNITRKINEHQKSRKQFVKRTSDGLLTPPLKRKIQSKKESCTVCMMNLRTMESLHIQLKTMLIPESIELANT